MTLKEQVRTTLDGLTPLAHGRQLVEAKEGGQHLAIELAALDRVGCAFDRLQLTSDQLAGAGIDRLKQVADALSQKLTYLLEPISPIEIDAHGCTVQLRSNPPSKDGDATAYYELLVEHTGSISLRRYSRQQKSQRTPIAAEVTRQVLLRLVEDFATAASIA
jgi:hypothetical protein